MNNKLHGKLDLSSNQFHCCSPRNTHLSLNSPLVTNSTSPNNVSSPTTSLITNSTTPSIVCPTTTSNPVVPNLQSIQSIPSISENAAINPLLSTCSSSSVPHVASSNPHSPSNLLSNHLAVCLYNPRSLVNKLSDFQSFVYSSHFDCLCIMETWLSDCIHDRKILPCGFSLHRKDRVSHGGGVLITVKHSLRAYLLLLIWKLFLLKFLVTNLNL